MKGLPDSSVGKEPACNAGDPGSIPGLERPPGEGIGYSLQYSWASLVQPVHSEGDQPWDFFGGNDAEAETPVLWPPHVKS